MAFPTLTQTASIDKWGEGLASDPAIRTGYEAGYVQTRARFTRSPRRWDVGYQLLPAADKELIRLHEIACHGGADSFPWLNDMDGVTYTVRYLGLVSYKPNKSKNYWDVDFTVEEV